MSRRGVSQLLRRALAQPASASSSFGGAASSTSLFSTKTIGSAYSFTNNGKVKVVSAALKNNNNSQSFNKIFSRQISVESLGPLDTFERRHNSASKEEAEEMARFVGFKSVRELIDATVPDNIKAPQALNLGSEDYNRGYSETEFLDMFKKMAGKNKVFKNYLGAGYHGTHVPQVILRNILENPGWYTQYTPYQAEISQGRLESLLNFQTMISDLTKMPLSNSSLLDEGTAAAEAMTMCSAIARGKKPKFYVSNKCHPQTIEICRTRADGLGLEVVVGDEATFDYNDKQVCGVMVQYRRRTAPSWITPTLSKKRTKGA